MKILLTLVTLLTLSSLSFAGRPEDIAKKYKMEFQGEQDKEWVFVVPDANLIFKSIPIVVKKGATDRDVQVAILAAANVAAFYELEIKSRVKEANDQEKELEGPIHKHPFVPDPTI